MKNKLKKSDASFAGNKWTKQSIIMEDRKWTMFSNLDALMALKSCKTIKSMSLLNLNKKKNFLIKKLWRIQIKKLWREEWSDIKK